LKQKETLLLCIQGKRQLKTFRLSTNLHFINHSFGYATSWIVGFLMFSQKQLETFNFSLKSLHKRKNVALHGVEGIELDEFRSLWGVLLLALPW
jgi:hypothetical protein